ncbi:hypothetical protein CEQ90_05640 [Lewinellaceae bacterium SD302]|nr:hypothetical protein CEQ90_05640 [Lewinellaceae bacterium SD302]
MKFELSLLLKGIAMGVAEAIPGVSGGTIAFITGIYERLLDAITKILDPAVITTLRKEGFSAAWERIDGWFLVQLVGGMAVGLIAAAFSITILLEEYPPAVWAFFFGLIIASAIYIGKQVGHWSALEIILFLAGAGFAYGLTIINPLGGSTAPIFVFLAGAIAISALILPGISGSFILVLLGMYTVILPAVKELLSGDSSQLITVGVFALGCLAGLALFSRVLSYTFKKFPNPTFAILTGFMLGSLNKLWPWRNTLTFRTNSSGEEVPLMEENVLPAAYQGDPIVLAVIFATLLGIILVFVMERLGRDELREELIEDED